MMQSRQIILANEPRLLRSMFRRVFGRMPAFEIAGEVSDLSKLPSLVDEKEVHWIIATLSTDGRLPDRLRAWHARHPSVGIVGLALDGSLVKIEEAGQVETAPSALSLDQLIAVLCQHPAVSVEGI